MSFKKDYEELNLLDLPFYIKTKTGRKTTTKVNKIIFIVYRRNYIP